MPKICFSQSELKKIIDNLPNLENKSQLNFVPSESTLPCDIKTFLPDAYLGISNPGVDSVKGYQQAYYRALSMYALSEKSSVIGINDLFKDEKNSHYLSSYQEYYEIKSKCSLPISAITVAKQYRLQNGETILFLSIDSLLVEKKERINVNTTVSVYGNEKNQNELSQMEGLIKIRSTYENTLTETNHLEILNLTYFNNHNIYIESIFDDEVIRNEKLKMFYELEAGCIPDSLVNPRFFSGTNDGLWYASVKNIYSQLSSTLNSRFSKIKKVGDSYGDNMLTLNRESGVFQLKFKLNGIYFLENKLYTKVTAKVQ